MGRYDLTYEHTLKFRGRVRGSRDELAEIRVPFRASDAEEARVKALTMLAGYVVELGSIDCRRDHDREWIPIYAGRHAYGGRYDVDT